MSQTCRLAAILAAAVARYSRLMGATKKARSNASNPRATSSSAGCVIMVVMISSDAAVRGVPSVGVGALHLDRFALDDLCRKFLCVDLISSARPQPRLIGLSLP